MESSSTTVLHIDVRPVDAELSRTRCCRPLLLELDKSHLASSGNFTRPIPIFRAIAANDFVLTTGTDAELSATSPVYPDGFIPETITTSLAASRSRVLVNYLNKTENAILSIFNR